MPADDERQNHPSSAHATVARIADMIGVSAEAFTDGSPEPLNVKGVSELLTIWVELDSDAERARLLTFARTLTAAS